jgi:acyl-CoA thioester hydrolase
MLRSLGFTYRDWEDSGIILPVREMHIRYHAPARYDDLLTVSTVIRDLPAARIRFFHEIYNEKGELLCTGNLDLVFVSRENGRPTLAPQEFLDALLRNAQSTD